MPKEPIRWQWGHRHLLMSDSPTPPSHPPPSEMQLCGAVDRGKQPKNNGLQYPRNEELIVTCTQLLFLLLTYSVFCCLFVVCYDSFIHSPLDHLCEVWLIVFKAPLPLIWAFIATASFSLRSAHERLFVGLLHLIGWGSKEKYSEISVHEVCWVMPLGTSPVRGDRTALDRGRSCFHAYAEKASANPLGAVELGGPSDMLPSPNPLS